MMSKVPPGGTADVLIVGAGPTGLMMACQLAIHRVSFRIIDKNESPLNNSGALIVQARSLEIFDQMQIAEEAIRDGIIASKLNIVFNGRKISSTVINDIGENLSKFPFLLMLEQSKTERLLLKFISDRGHSVERGVQFKSLKQDEEGITSVITLANGNEQTIQSKYVIAADGSKSTIRNFLNVSFKGKTYPKPIFILDCKAKAELNSNEIYFSFSDSSVAGFFPLQGSRWRIDGVLPKDMEKLGNEALHSIGESFHLSTKMKITFLGFEWFSVSHSHQKHAESMRIQNCFLAGDAAHIHTPVGAQGMNTGLQDAFNLAWKLAFVINGKATPEILDSYSMERKGISKHFARYADVVFMVMTRENAAVKILRLYLGRMLSVLLPWMKKRKAFRQRFFKSISQINLHYRHSILSYKAGEGSFLRGAPKPGDRLPYIGFFYKGRNVNTYEMLDIACFNLMVLANVMPDEMQRIAKKYNLCAVLIENLPETKVLYKSLGIKDVGFYLIRPDMHIALQSATLNTHHLNKYLQRFLI